MKPSFPFDERSPAAQLLGREVRPSPADSPIVELEYEARPEFTNRHGTVAGGFLAAMLDSATAAPVLLLLTAGQSVVTIDLQVRFERPARVGRLHATSRVVSRSDREITASGELKAPDGRVVARATAVFRVLDASPARR